MASRTGPARAALLLLCWMGALLSVHTAPVPDGDLKEIIIELRASSERLLESCKEAGLPKSTLHQLRPFASACRPPHYINSSAVLPYFRAVKRHPCLCENHMDIDDIIQQLEKPLFPRGPEANVSAPDNSLECKKFSWAVVEAFSTCVKSL
ncbi:interleukin-31 [Pipistrellus kuhlii]|uniref:Interleukin 31 n=1 Tax=Pipistrellus kuhlii TaxID=59472 RepID=A0A7J7UG10_PIPKU|nr:interleukin-31 [Pipistrellus kuhlii]KAF6311820.1 interleukin 31 [Pipistrellus kuhlii]